MLVLETQFMPKTKLLLKQRTCKYLRLLLETCNGLCSRSDFLWYLFLLVIPYLLLLVVYSNICSIYCNMCLYMCTCCVIAVMLKFFSSGTVRTPLDLLDRDSFDSRIKQILHFNLVHSMFMKTAGFCWFTFIRVYFNEWKMKQRHIEPKWGIIIFLSNEKNNDVNIYLPVYTVPSSPNQLSCEWVHGVLTRWKEWWRGKNWQTALIQPLPAFAR